MKLVRFAVWFVRSMLRDRNQDDVFEDFRRYVRRSR